MKDIKNYEGLYAITSCGKVWSYRSNKFLTPTKSKNGYLSVLLSADKKQERFYIHRLVREAYISNPLGLPQVNHKNENRTDNFINNLEWCDAAYNINYGARNEKTSKKRSIPVICLDTNIEYFSAGDAATQLGLHKSGIQRCCVGELKTTGGMRFKYKEDI